MRNEELVSDITLEAMKMLKYEWNLEIPVHDLDITSKCEAK